MEVYNQMLARLEEAKETLKKPSTSTNQAVAIGVHQDSEFKMMLESAAGVKIINIDFINPPSSSSSSSSSSTDKVKIEVNPSDAAELVTALKKHDQKSKPEISKNGKIITINRASFEMVLRSVNCRGV